MIVGWFASRHRDNDGGVFGGRGCVTQLKILLGWFLDLVLGKGVSIRRDREVSKLDKTWVENNTE